MRRCWKGLGESVCDHLVRSTRRRCDYPVLGGAFDEIPLDIDVLGSLALHWVLAHCYAAFVVFVDDCWLDLLLSDCLE
eukprot:2958532-Rhodomonas_salina.1